MNWHRLGGLLLGWALVVAPALVSAQEQQSSAAVPPSIRHLLSAHRLLGLDLPEFALEHLLEIDHETLPESHLPAYAGLIAHVALEVAFMSAELESLVASNLDAERLQPLAATWNAWGLVSIRDGRVSDALEAWDRKLSLQTSIKRRISMFRGVIARIARTDRGYIVYDPKIQAGALRSFVETWGKATKLGAEPEVVELLLALEQRLDAEGPEAQLWAERYLTLTEATPLALYRRGELELMRRRPDMALPWFLWAAYTDGLRSELSPRSWGALAGVYSSLGWCDRAAEAWELSLAPGEPPRCQSPTRNSPSTEECRAWHDRLLGYSPERMIVAWRGDWQRSVPDLNIWWTRCRWFEPNPFSKISASGHCSAWWGLPRLAASKLRHGRYGTLRGTHLLCTLTQTTLQSSALTGSFHYVGRDPLSEAPPDDRSRFREAWALFSLRQGELARALSDFEEALELETDPRRKAERLMRFSGALARSPVARGDVVARFVREKFAQVSSEAGGSLPFGSGLDVTVVLMKVAPRSPITLRQAEEVLVERSSSAPAWFHRGRIELHRNRAAAALPYLLWASEKAGDRVLHTSVVGPANLSGYGELARTLVGVYSRLRWWDLALDMAAKVDQEVPELSALEPGDILESELPGRCRSLRSQLRKAEPIRAVRAVGERWRERVPALAEWEALCTSKRPAAGGGRGTP